MLSKSATILNANKDERKPRRPFSRCFTDASNKEHNTGIQVGRHRKVNSPCRDTVYLPVFNEQSLWTSPLSSSPAISFVVPEVKSNGIIQLIPKFQLDGLSEGSQLFITHNVQYNLNRKYDICDMINSKLKISENEQIIDLIRIRYFYL